MRPEVREFMAEVLTFPLNASSAHASGRKAKTLLDNSHRKIAETIGAFANEVVFTASGTEANNWALRAFANRNIIVSAIEHPSILKTAASISESLVIPVTEDGVINLSILDALVDDTKDCMVSVMLANNETGVIQPIQEIAAIVHKKGGLLHCDAVQAFGKIPVDFTALGCDLMTISAHKMGGPVGAAALIVKNDLPLPPLLLGGGQELNRRAGTENIAAIVGFAIAAELMDLEQIKEIRGWLTNLATEAGKSQGREMGRNSERIPNTLCITMPHVSAETQIIGFDLEGISVSAGSACSSGKIEPSHVLKAMGLPKEDISTAIRISGGWATTEEDIVAATAAWNKLFQRKNEIAA